MPGEDITAAPNSSVFATDLAAPQQKSAAGPAYIALTARGQLADEGLGPDKTDRVSRS